MYIKFLTYLLGIYIFKYALFLFNDLFVYLILFHC